MVWAPKPGMAREPSSLADQVTLKRSAGKDNDDLEEEIVQEEAKDLDEMAKDVDVVKQVAGKVDEEVAATSSDDSSVAVADDEQQQVRSGGSKENVEMMSRDGDEKEGDAEDHVESKRQKEEDVDADVGGKDDEFWAEEKAAVQEESAEEEQNVDASEDLVRDFAKEGAEEEEKRERSQTKVRTLPEGGLVHHKKAAVQDGSFGDWSGLKVLHLFFRKDITRLPEKQEFVPACAEHLGELLAQLKMEYTGRNVPHVLTHECDVYASYTDFKWTHQEVDHAKRNCRRFAHDLADQFFGDKDYKGWCEAVHSYWDDNETPPDVLRAQHSKLLKEQREIQTQLEGLREEYKRSKEKAKLENLKAEAKEEKKDSDEEKSFDEGKMKDELDSLAEQIKKKRKAEAKKDLSEEKDLKGEADALEDDIDDASEEKEDEEEAPPCCPANCKQCSAAEEEDEPAASFLQVVAGHHHQKRSKSLRGGLVEAAESRGLFHDVDMFHMMIRYFDKFPTEADFTPQCYDIISDLMPKLHMHYTYPQVPKVLENECDVYATTTDYVPGQEPKRTMGFDDRKSEKKKLETATWGCKRLALKLAHQFQGDQDYEHWCGEVYSYLAYQKSHKEITAEEQRVLGERRAIRRKLEGLKKDLDALPCCPKDCEGTCPAF